MLLVCAGLVELGGTVCVVLDGASVLVTMLSDAVVVSVAVPPTITPPDDRGVAMAVEKVESTEAAEALALATAVDAADEAPAIAVEADDEAPARAVEAEDEAPARAVEAEDEAPARAVEAADEALAAAEEGLGIGIGTIGTMVVRAVLAELATELREAAALLTEAAMLD